MTDETISKEPFIKCLYVKSKKGYAEKFAVLIRLIKDIIDFFRDIIRFIFLHPISIATILLTFYVIWYYVGQSLFNGLILSSGNPEARIVGSGMYYIGLILAIIIITIPATILYICVTYHLTEPLQSAYTECLKERGFKTE